MSTTIAFLAETPGSPTIHDQKACLSAEDIPVLAGRRTFDNLTDLLGRKGIHLGVGDCVKVYDLSCIALPMPMLIRAVAKLLKSGVSFEICSPAIVIEPDGHDKLHLLVNALDMHYRHMHGIKTHPLEMARSGRKRLLLPEKLPAIRAMLNVPGATTSDVALSLGVARSTLFNYLARYDTDRRVSRSKKAVDADPENGSDQVEVSSPDTDGMNG